MINILISSDFKNSLKEYNVIIYSPNNKYIFLLKKK